MKKVLLTLSSGDLCSLIKQALSSKYEVECCDASCLRTYLFSTHTDALILDLFLPGTDGITLLRSLSRVRPPVVILLTDLLTDYLRLNASQNGVTEMILKPFSIRYLMGTLERCFNAQT